MCWRAVERGSAAARLKRSPEGTANWASTKRHSQAALVYSFLVRFKTRNKSYRAASSVGNRPQSPRDGVLGGGRAPA